MASYLMSLLYVCLCLVSVYCPVVVSVMMGWWVVVVQWLGIRVCCVDMVQHGVYTVLCVVDKIVWVDKMARCMGCNMAA